MSAREVRETGGKWDGAHGDVRRRLGEAGEVVAEQIDGKKRRTSSGKMDDDGGVAAPRSKLAGAGDADDDDSPRGHPLEPRGGLRPRHRRGHGNGLLGQ